MAARLECPKCGHEAQVSSEVWGKKIRCPECEHAFVARRGDDREEPQPSRSKMPLVLGAVALLSLGLGVTAVLGVYYFVSDKPKPNAPEIPVAVQPVAPRPVVNDPRLPDVVPPKKNTTLPKNTPLPKRPTPRKEPRGQLATQALKDLKAATVYIKVESGPFIASGSGFVCHVEGNTAYIATNNHVIDPTPPRLPTAPPRKDGPPTSYHPTVRLAGNALLVAVFDSGTTQERTLRAEIVSTDPARDLAVLRVKSDEGLPKPIDIHTKAELSETMPVYILGFPFGQTLALKQDNPGVTIHKGSVSGLRDNEHGQLSAVQIDGAINPGNSGGPVVDEDGHLVGVAVAAIRGSGIGLAIAPDELTKMIRGRLGAIQMRPMQVAVDVAYYDVNVGLLDPLKQIQSASLLYKATTKIVAPFPQKNDDTYAPLADAQELQLKSGVRLTGPIMEGTLILQRTGLQWLTYQIVYVTSSGEKRYTQLTSQQILPEFGNLPLAAGSPPPRELLPKDQRPKELPIMDVEGASEPIVSGDFAYREIKMPARNLTRKILWAADGQSFYTVETDTGVVRNIALDGFKELKRATIEPELGWLAMSGEGLLVTARKSAQLYLLDPQTLEVKRKVAVPRIYYVTASPTGSLAYAAMTANENPDFGGVNVIDLKKGEILKRHTLKSLRGDQPRSSLGLDEPTLTPDGKWLFARGSNQLHRYKVDGATLTYEESSEQTKLHTNAVELSAVGQWIALPSSSGNSRVPQPISVYATSNLAKPAFVLETGGGPRAIAFDGHAGHLFSHNDKHALIVFNMEGVKQKHLEIATASTRHIAVHPKGGSLLLLTTEKLYYVTVKK